MLVTDKHFREWAHGVLKIGDLAAAYLPPMQALLQSYDEEHDVGLITTVEAQLGTAIAAQLLRVLSEVDILEYDACLGEWWLTSYGEALHAYVTTKTPAHLVALMQQPCAPHQRLCTPDVCYCPGAVSGQGCHNNPLFAPVWLSQQESS